MEAMTTYFDAPDTENTEKTLSLAKARAVELCIGTIVIATTTGATGVKATEQFHDRNIIVVTHTAGFKSPGNQELTPENREKMKKLGAHIYTGTHAFGGIAHAVRKTYNTYILGDFIANVLRMFGQGVKVAIEITLMATDAGLIDTNAEIIAIAGTGRGADTALVIKPAHTHDAFSLRVKEIICKPRF